MSGETKADACLSEHAEVLLDYLQRYDGNEHSERFMERNLRIKFPLFRYLFPDGDAIDSAIRELGKAGLTKRVQELVDESLLVREHVRIEGYIKENDEAIIRRIPLSEIKDTVDSEDVDDNVTFLCKWLSWRWSYDVKKSIAMSQQYAAAQQESWSERDEKRKLVGMIAELAKLKSLASDVTTHQIVLSRFVGDSIGLQRESQICFVVLDPGAEHHPQFREVVAIRDRLKSDLLVIISLRSEKGFKEEIEAQVGPGKNVLLDEEDLKYIALSVEPSQELKLRIISQLPLIFVSPYRFRGPVGGEIFFGRVGELSTILELPDANYCVLGARQIGKTSFLHALRDKVNQEHVLEDTVAVYVDASQHTRIDRFQKNLLQEVWNTQEQQGVPEIQWVDPGEDYFEDLAEKLKASRKRYLFLLDEVDQLLGAKDAGLLEAFARSMANEGYASFVFCGYRTLNDRVRNQESLIFNLLDPIRLGPLKGEEARSLVTEPMARIGVAIEREVVDRILDKGSRVPSLLQYMCYLLLEHLHERGGERRIRLEDVDSVYEGQQFSDEVTAIIRDNKDLPTLERLIVYLAVGLDDDDMRESHVIEEVRRVLYSAKFSDIRAALDYLTSTYVFYKVGDKYRFVVPQLKRKLYETEPDLDYVIHSLATEYRERYE
jgi:hypothetical protein